MGASLNWQKERISELLSKLPLVLLVVLPVGSGCKKPTIVDTDRWTQPRVLSHTIDSLNSGFSLHRWNNTLLVLNNDTGPLEIYILAEDGTKWERKADAAAVFFPLDTEPTGSRFVACGGLRSKDHLTVTFVTGMFDSTGVPEETSRATCNLDKATLFRNAGTNIFFEYWTMHGRVPQPFWGATFDGPAVYVPYCVQGQTIRDGVLVAADGPFDNGIFASSDSGKSWQRQSIDNSFSSHPHVCGTERSLYYIAGRPESHELWFSEKYKNTDRWSPPQVLTRHLATRTEAVTSADTIHLCWLDRRHEKKRLSLVYPNRENYEVAYCRRKDSDASWSKDVILSEGLLYAYSPSMSVEDDNIVVAWAGANDKDGHDENWPNDIYYVVSKDAGKTWTKPLRVTDGFKDGITSGQPQVALHKGVIHLVYIQGKINYKQVSAGMAKLNQPPWPIYYQRRPFPD